MSLAEPKLGATVYSYGFDLRAGTMRLADCVADIADMGGTGVEILGESHVPGFPEPSDVWVGDWFRLLDETGTEPSAFDGFIDTMLFKDRLLTIDETVDQFVRDIKLAQRLGFKVIRTMWPPYAADDPADEIYAPYVASGPAREALEKALPYAEKFDITLAIELHSPAQLKSAWMDQMVGMIETTGTRHFGFVPDMSIFLRRPPRHREANLIAQGAREPILRFIAEAYADRLGPEKTVAEVVKMGGNAVETHWAGIGGLYHFSNNDPKDLARYLPYCCHIHAKFYEMTEDLREYSIPYEEIVPVLVAGGYQGYLSSEYEGPRTEFQTSAQIRLHQAMLRRLWAEASTPASPRL